MKLRWLYRTIRREAMRQSPKTDEDVPMPACCLFCRHAGEIDRDGPHWRCPMCNRAWKAWTKKDLGVLWALGIPPD